MVGEGQTQKYLNRVGRSFLGGGGETPPPSPHQACHHPAALHPLQSYPITTEGTFHKALTGNIKHKRHKRCLSEIQQLERIKNQDERQWFMISHHPSD